MYIFPSIQAKGKAKLAVFTPLPSPTELLLPDIVTLISRRGKDTLEELSVPFFMTQEEAALSSKSTSEIHINTRNKPSTSLQLREHILDNTFSAEGKQLFQLETFSPWIKSQKVPPSATLNPLSEIKDHTLDVQALMQPLLVTPMMELRLESDFHQDQERQVLELAEPLWALLLEEAETKSPSWKLVFFSTNSKDWERDSPKWLVSEWIPSTILTVVVITSIWVSPEQWADMHLLVKRLVSSQLEEQVLSEVPKQSRTPPKKSDYRGLFNPFWFKQLSIQSKVNPQFIDEKSVYFRFSFRNPNYFIGLLLIFHLKNNIFCWSVSLR